MDELEAGLPEELIGTSDGLTNGETNEIPIGGSDLQQLLQSSGSTLSTSVNSTLNPSTVTTSSCSAPNSPALTTLTTVNSPSVGTPISSPPQMPVSTLGTPTPATPLTSSGELHLSSIGHSAAPPPSSISQMNSGLQSQTQFNNNYTSVQQYSSPQLNMMANSSPVMATVNGPGSVPGGSPMNMNSISRPGTGPVYSRPVNMSLSNPGLNSFGNSMAVSSLQGNSISQLSQEQQQVGPVKLEQNFLAHHGINGTPEPPTRQLSSGQVGEVIPDRHFVNFVYVYRPISLITQISFVVVIKSLVCIRIYQLKAQHEKTVGLKSYIPSQVICQIFAERR